MKIINDKILPTFENMVFYDNKLWFTEYNCNEFYYYDIYSQETVFVCSFEKEKAYGDRLFYTIIPYKNNMYLTPFSASRMYKVDIFSKAVSEIKIANPSDKLRQYYRENARLMSAHLCDGKIYMIPASYPAILEYDCEYDRIVYYTDWIEQIKKKFVNSDSAFFRKTLLLEKKIYMPLCKGNAVAIFNVDSKEVDVKEVGDRECSYSSICFDGKRFWLSPRGKGPIVCWDEIESKYQEYNQFPTGYIKLQGSYGDIIFYKGEVLLIPMCSAMVLNVNIENGTIKEFGLGTRGANFMCQGMNANNLYLFSIQTCQLYMIDLDNMRIEERNIYFPPEVEKYHRKHLSTTYKVLHKLKFPGICCHYT